MKIAIYGDSFANSQEHNAPGDLIDRGKSWVEHLSEIHEVFNFSCSGSSLFYSYKLFLENNKNFDYNIFLITEPNRITLPYNPSLTTDNEPGLTEHINLNIVNSFSRFSDNNNHNIIISALKSYYSLIHNMEATKIFHNLMVNDIKRLNQNTIVIPCFRYSTPLMEISLNCISAYEYDNSVIMKTLWKNRYYTWKHIEDENGKWTFNDYRKCHLNEENNKILSTIINNAIINKQQTIDLDLNQFVQSSKDIEYYHLYIDLTQVYHERRLNGELHNLYNKLLIDTN